MENKAIKVSIENYRWLAHIAAELQKEKERPISLDEALTNIKKQKKDILSFAGSWKLTENENEKIKKDLAKGWKSWRKKSA